MSCLVLSNAALVRPSLRAGRAERNNRTSTGILAGPSQSAPPVPLRRLRSKKSRGNSGARGSRPTSAPARSKQRPESQEAETRRLSLAVQDLVECERVCSELEATLGRAPSPNEWARACGESGARGLARRLRRGRAAKERFVARYQWIATRLAKKYAGGGLAVDDLLQEANIGLLRGVERFNPDKGEAFSSYGRWYVFQAVTRAATEQGRTIRLPVYVHEAMHKVRRAEEGLARELGRAPTASEIAARAGLSEGKLEALYDAPWDEPISLDDGGDLLEDEGTEPPEEAVAQHELRGDLYRVLRREEVGLKEQEVEVLLLRFGLDDGEAKALSEIARRMNVSQQRIGVVEKKALGKLRAPGPGRRLLAGVGGIELDTTDGMIEVGGGTAASQA